MWAGVAGLFRDYGYRRLRHRARIKFLVAGLAATDGEWHCRSCTRIFQLRFAGTGVTL